jgi:hypothetical protein
MQILKEAKLAAALGFNLRVARFILAQDTKTLNIYQITLKYAKWR